MRTGFVNPRLLMKAGSVALLWMLFASIGYAAPAPRPGGAIGRACAATAASVRKLARHPKSLGGPVALPSKRALVGLIDAVARLQRGTGANLAGDDEVIQSDASAARVEIDDRSVPALRPLGVLPGSFDRLPRSYGFSPRSPRGPPIQT